MNPQSPQLDLVTVFITIAAALFGKELAGVVGPYAVIFLGAILGGAWSASRRPATTRLALVGYLAAVVIGVLMVTVPAAELIASRYPAIEVRWMLGPVAVIVGGIGGDWPKVIAWFLGLFRSVVERWATRQGAGDPNQPPGGQQ